MEVTEPDHEGVAEQHFALLLGAAMALGAAIRFAYVLTDRRRIIGGDGYEYHFEALRFADGHPYTSVFSSVGAPTANHPPGWVTLLGLISWLGGRSWLTHQLVSVVVGLGVVVLAGLIGRRYFSARVGLVAAVIAALYPGFWVVEGNVLSEPLDLLLVGVLTLAVVNLRDRPTLRLSLAIGAICGLLALVRAEHVALLFLVVVPVLIAARTLSLRRRVALIAAAVVLCGLVISPWTIYNSGRFKEPVILSTTSGGLLLAGNCPPFTYSGTYLGYYGGNCWLRAGRIHPGIDPSQEDVYDREMAVRHIKANLDKLPVTVAARFGRLLAVFRPSQTVAFTVVWMRTDNQPIWAWVVSYWALLPLALVGAVHARRSRKFLLPLLAPLVVVGALVAISYGEPRYHTPADLGVVVLAAAGADRVLARLGRYRGAIRTREAVRTSDTATQVILQ